MAVSVVDILQPVHVAEQEREHAVVRRAAANRALVGATVSHSREVVELGLGAQLEDEKPVSLREPTEQESGDEKRDRANEDALEWNLPKPDPTCTTAACATVRIDWELGKTRLVLPVVGAPAGAATLFDTGG